MLEIKDLNKSFGKRTLFKDYNLTVGDGEFVIIFGASGAGKTTLLNMIGGLEDVTSGRIRIDDVEVTGKRNDKVFFGQTVGFLFQNFGLLEEETVYKNLSMVPKRNRSNISIETAMEKTGVAGLRDSKVYRLSGGEQQRVALCRLMVKKCRLILADEPTGNLDEANAKRVMTILRDICREGCTVLVVTHDTRLIEEGDRVIKLDGE